MSQLDFAEGFFGSGIGRNDKLEKIAEILNLQSVSAILEPLVRSDLGRPPYPPLTMFKALLLQQ